MSKLMNATLVGLAAAALAAPVAYADVSDVGRPNDVGRMNPLKMGATPNPWKSGVHPNPMKSSAMPNPWRVGARANPWRSLGGQRMAPWAWRGYTY